MSASTVAGYAVVPCHTYIGGAPGEIDLGSGPGGSPFGLSGYWGRFAFDFAATAAPYALFHLWRATHLPRSPS
jgi:hypothetical protein